MIELTPELKAGILVEALPYIQEYYGKIVVIKYGGNAMINEELKQAVISDLVLLNLVGIKVGSTEVPTGLIFLIIGAIICAII